MKDKLVDIHLDMVVVDDFDYMEDHIQKMSAMYNGKSAFENYKSAKERQRKFIRHIMLRGNS